MGYYGNAILIELIYKAAEKWKAKKESKKTDKKEEGSETAAQGSLAGKKPQA